MGRASISIAITSNFNSSGIDAAIRKAEQLAAAAVHYQGKFGKSAVDMGASMGQASARLVSMGKSMADLGDRLTTHVTVPMGLAATAAVMAATKIDTAWYNVRKTVDMTEEGYQRLKDGAMALAETQPVSADTILDIESLGGQLGIANDQLENFAKIVSGLDIATNMNADLAATSLARFRNIVQMNEDELDNFASALVDLGNHSATTESEIMDLALRFASAGHVAGMSNQEILGISAALSSLGMRAEAGGSALSRVINDISVAVDTNGEHLQAWADLAGQSVEEFSKSWKEDAAGTFELVLKGIAESGDEMNAALEEAGVTQIRTSDAMRRLASSGDLMAESVERANKAWAENTALTREVDNRNESLQARWDTVVNRFTNDLARIGEPIARIGLDALEGLEPAIQGIGDLAQAFASASPEVQQFAFNLGAVAMAAGPILSVGGRLLQTIGNMGIRVGRATQQWGVYREAVKTTDVSMLNTLATNQSVAASFGASRNAIVKAAGGLDRYNIAYAKTTNAIRDRITKQIESNAYQKAYNEAIATGSKTESEAVVIANKYVKSRQVQGAINKRVKASIDDLNGSIDESNVAVKLNTESITEAETAAAKASRTFGSFGSALKGAFVGFGVSAAIGAVVTGITWLVTQLQEAAEHADLLDRATNGLNDALRGTGDAAEEASAGHRDLMASIGETQQHVETAIENQAELADKFREIDSSAATSMHSVDRAREAIEQYANHTGLTASEQYRLESAIEAVNQAGGDQWQIVDAANGVIADQNGVIQENTDAILANVDALKQRIQMQALESKYQAAYENYYEMQMAHAEAVERHAQAIERRDELEQKEHLTWEEGIELQELNLHKIDELQQAVDDTDLTLGQAGATVESVERQLNNMSEAGDAAAKGLEKVIEPASRYSSAFENLEDKTHDVVEFMNACYTAGLSFEALETLTDSELREIANNFDGTTASIVRSLEDLGRVDFVSHLGDNWLSGLDFMSQQIASGIAKVHGVSVAELAAMATDMGVKGEEATRRFLLGMQAGLNAGLDTGQAAKLAERIAKEFEGALTPEQAAKVAQEFLNNIARGMSDTGALDAAIQALKSSLSQVSFADDGNRLGSEFFASVRAPIEEGFAGLGVVLSDQGDVVGRLGAGSIKDGVVAGIGEGQPEVDASAQGLIGSLIQSLLAGVPQAEDAGQQTGSGYGNSVSGQGAVAEAAAMNTLGRLLQIWLLGIASAQQAGLRTGQAYGQGVQSSAALGVSAVQATMQTILSIMNAAVGPATAAGQQTGAGYGLQLSARMVIAQQLTVAAVNAIVKAMASGVSPAMAAGLLTGAGYSTQLRDQASKAVGYATSISVRTGAAFGAGRGAAAAAGSALGNAFANAVASSASRAVSIASSVRSQVASIFSNIPTANIKVNVQRTYSNAPSSSGGRPVQYAALGPETPAFRVAGYAAADRAATVAERAVRTIAGVRTSQTGGATSLRAAVTEVAASGGSGPVDYDAMYRVVKGGVKAAIQESGGLVPDVKLDGKSIVDHVDRELGRRQAMWG